MYPFFNRPNSEKIGFLSQNRPSMGEHFLDPTWISPNLYNRNRIKLKNIRIISNYKASSTINYYNSVNLPVYQEYPGDSSG